jgi:hypothetical protein
LAGCCALLVAGTLRAGPPSEQLLPRATKGYLSIGNLERFRADWAKTQPGQLLADPIMQPFVEDFQRQQRDKSGGIDQTLGISWDDLSKVAAGEAAFAVIQPAANQAAQVLIADVTGRKQQTAALLDKIKTNLTGQPQAKASQIDVSGISVTSYALPKTKQQSARTALFCVTQERLIAADNLAVLQGILGRFAAAGDDSLSALPAFQWVITRCQQAAGERVPHVRWFVEPFGFVEARRVANRVAPHPEGTDMLKVLKEVGFTAIQGAGGYVHLATEKFEILHQTAVYAPPVKTGNERYELAAAMLDFPNGGDFQPQPWVPREIATFTRLNFEPQKAFEALGPLVDGIYRQKGGFKDMIDSIEEDPYGAHINLRTDVIALLGGRATIVFDYLLPITPDSEQILIAVETTDVKTLTANIDRMMKAESNATPRDYKGRRIWEIKNPDTDVAKTNGKNRPAVAKQEEEKDDDEDAGEHLFPNSSVTVAHGQMLIASHYDFLTKMLDDLAQRDQLADSNQYRLVKTDLDYLAGGDACAQTFSRSDEEFRAIYDLIRAGRMPESQTVLGKLLNSFLGESKDGAPRAQRINGQRLPEYDAVRRYFGPAGMTAVSQDQGWFLTGFMLAKEPSATGAEKTVQDNRASPLRPALLRAASKPAG